MGGKTVLGMKKLFIAIAIIALALTACSGPEAKKAKFLRRGRRCMSRANM
jgi:uncharacterized lipoprotein YmbA